MFIAISLQYSSTLAILSKESESRSLTVKMFLGYFAVVYVAALAVFQVTSLLLE